MKARSREIPNETTEFLKGATGQKFIRWWAMHRHSGYATRGVETRWGTPPYLACKVDRYMAEFYADHKMDEKTRYNYEASEYEAWARQQEEFENRAEVVVHRKGYI